MKTYLIIDSFDACDATEYYSKNNYIPIFLKPGSVFTVLKVLDVETNIRKGTYVIEYEGKTITTFLEIKYLISKKCLLEI